MYNILYIWLESFSLLLHSASNQLYGYAQLVINDAWGFSASGYARANCVNLNGNGIFVVRACEIRSLLIAATHRVKYTHIHTHMLAVSLQNPFICLYYSFLTLTLSLSLSVLLYCGYLAKRNRSRVSHWQTENTEIYVRHFRLWLTGGKGGGEEWGEGDCHIRLRLFTTLCDPQMLFACQFLALSALCYAL